MATVRLRPALALLLLPAPAVGMLVVDVALDRPPAVYAHLDAAPPGVDIHREPSVGELRREVRLNQFPGRPPAEGRRLLSDGEAPRAAADGAAPRAAADGAALRAAADGLRPTAVAAGPIPGGDPGLRGLSAHVAPSCSGTGRDGKRVQVIYAVEQGKKDRYRDLQPMLRSWVADVDDTFAVSAGKTGGGLRVRWVHRNCVPVIGHEVLPSGALRKGFAATTKALKTRGYKSKSRKYLVFADDTTLCGIGEMYDDSGRTSNANDGAYPMFARVDSPCWSFPEGWHSTAAHELLHTLGGVQDNAPHSTRGGHCRDEADVMCYKDSGSVTVREVCRNTGDEGLFDCRDDDYFNTAPAPGSYLATHWNPADSAFLDNARVLPSPPRVTMSGPPGVRPGLAATFTARSSTPVSYRWSARPAACLPGAKTRASATVMCPSYYTGSMRLSVSAEPRGVGLAGAAARTVRLTTSPKTSVTVRLAATPANVASGTSTRLNATLRYGRAAVRGQVYLYRAPASGGTYTKIAGPVDTGTDGAHAWTVTPTKSARYAVLVGYNPSGGWRTPPQRSTSIKVTAAGRRR